MPQTHRFPSADATTLALCERVSATLTAILAGQDRAVLAVSGGRSPIPLFRALAQQDLPWHRITVTLVDERCVPSDHRDSNARLVRTHLLTGYATSAAFRPLWLQAATAEALIASAIGQWQTPDLTLLGMGEDGHTASLFPGAATLPAGLDADTAAPLLLVDPPAAPHRRISMTAAEIARSGQVFLSIAGAAKQAVLEQALASPSPHWPVGAVLAGCPAAEIFSSLT
ncbi:6-phosphogluconolactonase [Novispirillum itersonii]|uniref:6-phosphogluconolactonase n=1 Tax=Novispirillum itersonii TaxID=189 RepID=A0A7W9ZIT6_NOVIT|nr:6-phosphogluconolactonase [Novispirillum itersonii]MBB6212231.1 6-phosphogluconolactonase [Novispirillum itersonii]